MYRVSRSVSIWYGALDPSQVNTPFSNPVYSQPLMEPRIEDQPPGTGIEVAVRGASNIDADAGTNAALKLTFLDGNIVQWAQADANFLDIYGDSYWSQDLHNPPGRTTTSSTWQATTSWSTMRGTRTSPRSTVPATTRSV
ncbi:MAG: hypothetical protein R3E96_04240 [Planctomycetota bacterium]